MTKQHSEILINAVIAMAWKDDISFDKIKKEMDLSESEVIKIMRKNLKAGSFRLWRKRVTGRKSKHERKTELKDASNQNLLNEGK